MDRFTDETEWAKEFDEQAALNHRRTAQAAMTLARAAREACRRVDVAGRVARNSDWTARHDADAADELLAAWAKGGFDAMSRGILSCVEDDPDGLLGQDPATDVALGRYEGAAQGAWADIEFCATAFRDEFPAPEADEVDADTLADVRTLAELAAAARIVVERRMLANADALTAKRAAAKTIVEHGVVAEGTVVVWDDAHHDSVAGKAVAQ